MPYSDSFTENSKFEFIYIFYLIFLSSVNEIITKTFTCSEGEKSEFHALKYAIVNKRAFQFILT